MKLIFFQKKKISILILLFNVFIKRGFFHFLYEVLDLIFIDLKYNSKTYARKNDGIDNYVPYYTGFFVKILRILKNKINFKNSYFIDLGSGKGRILLKSSEYNFFKVIGVEKNKNFYTECKNVLVKNNLTKKVNLINKDFLKFKYKFLSKKNIVFFWYNPSNKTYLIKAIKSYKKKYKKNNVYLIIIPSSSVPNLPFIKKIKILNNFSNDKSRNLALIKILN